MTTAGVPSRSWRAAVAAALYFAVLGLTGCASDRYAGIPLTGAADPELQTLARRARAGDARAHELGLRFEQGRGVPRDLARAERLYRGVAGYRGGARHTYMPPVGNGGRESVARVDRPRDEAVAQAARARLGALRVRTRGGEEPQHTNPAAAPPAARDSAATRPVAAVVDCPPSGLADLREPALCVRSAFGSREIWDRLAQALAARTPALTVGASSQLLGVAPHLLEHLGGRRLVLITSGEPRPIEFSVRTAEHRCTAHVPALHYGDLCPTRDPIGELTIFYVPAPGGDGCLGVGDFRSRLQAAGWEEVNPAPAAPRQNSGFLFDAGIRDHAVFKNANRKIYFGPPDDGESRCVTRVTYYVRVPSPVSGHSPGGALPDPPERLSGDNLRFRKH